MPPASGDERTSQDTKELVGKAVSRLGQRKSFRYIHIFLDESFESLQFFSFYDVF